MLAKAEAVGDEYEDGMVSLASARTDWIQAE